MKHLVSPDRARPLCGAAVKPEEACVFDIAFNECKDCDTLHNIFIAGGGVKAPAKLLDMLEELLSITETKMSNYASGTHEADDFRRWQVISAKVADIREGSVRDDGEIL